MRFAVLGPLIVEDDHGQGIKITQPLQRACLTVLLLRHDTRVPTRDLTSALWRGYSPAHPGESLRTCVCGLRRTLGDGRGRVGTMRDGWMIQVLTGELDLDEFRRLAASGREAIEAKDMSLADSLLTAALAFWRRPPLDDIPEPLRLELTSLYRATRAAWTEARLQAGRAEELVSVLYEQARTEPTDERAVAHLMIALALSGNALEALNVYRTAHEFLRDEFGMEPGQRLMDVQTAILRGDLARLGYPIPGVDPLQRVDID